MKLKLTESQYISLLKYINEGVTPPPPTNLSGFFKQNPETAYFTIVKLIQKTKDETEYLFGYGKVSGFNRITDENPGTPTRGCVTDVNLDMMIFDDEFRVKFASCNKTLTINNVVGIRLFDEKRNKLDEMEFDNTSTEDTDSLVRRYNEELSSTNNGDNVFFDAFRKQYNGIVYNKGTNRLEIELEPIKDKNILIVNTDSDGFYEDNDNIFFQATKRNLKKNIDSEFNIPIKTFYTSSSGKPQEPEVNDPDNQETEPEETEPQEPEAIDPNKPNTVEPLSDEELEAQAKLAYDEILNDKDMQRAFYRKPNFWNLFMAELKGESAKGKGIYPTLQIVKGYKSNKIDARLNGNFYEGRQVKFTPYDKDIYIYQEGTRNLIKSFKRGATSQAKVAEVNFGDNTKKLINSGHYDNYTVTIKSLTDVQDVYLCDIEASTFLNKQQISGTEKDVHLQFDPKSPGYRPIKTQTKP